MADWKPRDANWATWARFHQLNLITRIWWLLEWSSRGALLESFQFHHRLDYSNVDLISPKFKFAIYQTWNDYSKIEATAVAQKHITEKAYQYWNLSVIFRQERWICSSVTLVSPWTKFLAYEQQTAKQRFVSFLSKERPTGGAVSAAYSCLGFF